MHETVPPILLVGCGKMGGALLAGWCEKGLAPSVVVDPTRPAAPAPGVTVVGSLAEIPAGFRPEAVVFAVKPQFSATVPDYRPLVGNALVVSIIAGKTLAWLHQGLGPEAAIVRAMPNTPAAVRQGITAACPGTGVSPAQRALCATLLSAVGEVAWVEDEKLIDPITAVSGGGPAYVFLLAEVLEAAAIEQGIPPELARRLARVTVSGSGALLAASPESAAQLRINVTSPKGTTERALAVLMEKTAWPELMSKAIAAATARSRELAG